MDLSIDGSQVSVGGSARRPSSGRKSHSATSLHQRSKAPAGSNRGLPSPGRTKKAETGSRTATSKSSNPPPPLQDDFLALFESNTKPKVNSRTQSRNHGGGEPLSLRGSCAGNSARSTTSDKDTASRIKGKTKKFSHSVFEPSSARSTSTVDDLYSEPSARDPPRKAFDSASSRQGRSAQTNHANNAEKRQPSWTDNSMQNGSKSSLHSQHELDLKLDSNRTHRMEGPSVNGALSHNDASPLSPLDQPHKSQNLNLHSNSVITNNMTSHARATTKTALSDIENSFQNIKHKTPINQVRQTRPVKSRAAEDQEKTRNMAACKIQRWFQRRMIRRKAGEAAMKRLFEAKHQEQEGRLRQERDYTAGVNHTAEDDRKKRREEMARQSRLQAIDELNKKREEKRQENKATAEQEIKYLQASGKITKQGSKSNLKKKTIKKPANGNQDSKSDVSEPQPARPSTSSREPNVGALLENSINELQAELETAEDNSAHNINLNRVEGAAEGGMEGEAVEVASQAVTKTTFDDLMDTLKQLEQDERFPSTRKEKSSKQAQANNWVDGLDRSGSESDGEREDFLTVQRLRKLNPASKDNLKKEGLLSEEKIKSIMSFLDEVETADRLSDIDHLQEMSRANDMLMRPALPVPSAEELADMEQATATASEITSQMMSQRLELEEKQRSVGMLQKALNQQRELTVRHARETEKEMKKRLDVQKDEYEETIKRHLSFIDQLIDDKKALSDRCESLVQEMKTLDKKYSDKMKAVVDKHKVELQNIKDVQAAAEKLRRERWIEEKTKKIKEMTVKGLEPEIQRLIASHKADMKKMKSIQEAELLEADERAGSRYVKMTEELRDQLASEKEAACARERELARQTYEKQMQQEEEAYQQQRRRLYSEVQEEKERLSQHAARQRAEIDRLQRQLEDNHAKSSEAMRQEYEKAREEQERRHQAEIKQLREQLTLEKQVWEENYMKKQETWLMQKERELKEGVRRERDKEIELVITRLEEDSQSARDECERVAENRIKRIRDKYEGEISELERMERIASEKHNEAKAKLVEAEGECGRQKVVLKQKDKEINELKRILDKHNKERDVVSDVIRQEFADRLVAIEEENKRVKNEISEQKARHRLEISRTKTDMELLQKAKEEEMAEVHKRVKQAISKKEEVVTQLREQYEAALKRADHLEGLLEQQRKQLLGRK